MNASSRPIVIAAGGTGGHVFPALAVADILRERDVPVVWIGTRKGLEAKAVPQAGIPIHWISVAGLRGKGLLGLITGPFRLLAAIAQSYWVIARLKPRAVLGMGGFVTGPVGIAAKLNGRPLVLHEQNAVAGLTNRKLARFASTVFTAMPNAFSSTVETVLVGNPLRREIELSGNNKNHENTKINDEKTKNKTDNNAHVLNVLIVGGSQGAQVLNTVVPDTLKHLNFAIKLVHQSGLSMYETVKHTYDSRNENTHDVEVKKFIDNMTQAYLWADLVVCRSGAMTVSELAAMSLPSVLVPFPHAVDDHQTKNAEFLKQAGGAVLIPEELFTAERLSEVLNDLFKNKDKLEQMSRSARTCHRPSAATKVADTLLGFVVKVNSSSHGVSA